MKKTALLLSFILLLTACKKTVINGADYADIIGSIEDIIIDEGIGVYRINLEETFFVEGDKKRIIDHKIENNSNPALLFVQINEATLELKLNTGETGKTTIKIRSESGAVLKITEFIFTVNSISAQDAMGLAIGYFAVEEYELSFSHFKLVTRKNEVGLFSDAFMGAGFSKMRFNYSEDDLGYNDFLQSLAFDNTNVDAIAGLSFLEFAQKQNFSEAIRKGNEVLQKDGNFVFSYDPNIDKNDIMLNIALSQFSLKNYTACLQSIQLMEPGFSADPNDADFLENLLTKLNELIILYSHQVPLDANDQT